MTYAARLKFLLSPAEQRLFTKLSTLNKIQDFLDHSPANFGNKAGEAIINSPSNALNAHKFHCMEGAVFAAAALAYHGREPLLMDFQTTNDDEDHVIALFKERGYWGAISKTNHPVLRWRDPIYKTPRELAMSYFNEYFLWHKSDGKKIGNKTLRAYSKPFDLRRYDPAKWWAAKDLDWLAEALDKSPHFPVVPRGAEKLLRKARPIEINAMQVVEWKKPKN